MVSESLMMTDNPRTLLARPNREYDRPQKWRASATVPSVCVSKHIAHGRWSAGLDVLVPRRGRVVAAVGAAERPRRLRQGELAGRQLPHRLDRRHVERDGDDRGRRHRADVGPPHGRALHLLSFHALRRHLQRPLAASLVTTDPR